LSFLFLRHLILCRHLFVIWYDVHHVLYSVVLILTLRSGNGDSTGAML